MTDFKSVASTISPRPHHLAFLTNDRFAPAYNWMNCK
jgi:hypothetical protein